MIVLTHLPSYLFADDTNIDFESDSINTLQKVVNMELRYVKKWLDANKLALNIDKANCIIFHSAQNPLIDHVNIKIGNQHIKQNKYVKFLGLLLDKHLSSKYYLCELYKKLSMTCGIFFKVRHLLPITVLVSFISFFILIISAVWNHCLGSHL